jgi:type I restriction enzyme S subunit
VEVRPGYKQTEVGVIPEDWALKPMAGIATTVASGRSSVDSEFGDFPVYGSTGTIGRSVKGDYAGRAILVARVGANAGTLNVVDGEYGVTDNTIIVRVSDSVLWSYVWRQLDAKRLNSLVFGSGQPLITGTQLKNLLVPFPPTKAEQEAIAEALSDADVLIGSLEQLLVKKRQLKQGAMQELLTGTTRLPGFEGEWETKRLGDCFASVSTRNAELNDNVVTISAQQGFVRQEEFFKKRVASAVLENYYLIETGHFAYNRSHSNGYPFGAIKRLTQYDKGVVTTLYICFALKPEAESDPTFFEHYFEAGLLNSGLALVTNEGGRAHGLLNITKADFFNREIKRPLLLEQTAIATILSDMDAEIAALGAKHAKARQLKQGMMQELLTGKIRLV